jgi:surfeit locus 1 family protein
VTPEPLYPEERRRPGRFWVITLAAVLTVAATVSLGRWQLRAPPRRKRCKPDIDAQKLKPPLTQAEFLAMDKATDALHRPVRLRGLWLTPQTVYLDNRQMHGTPGFYVLTPFALEGTEQTVMVQRGWIQRNFVDRTQLGAVETPAGIVEVTGLIEPPPSHLLELGTAHARACRFNSRGFGARLGSLRASHRAPAVEGSSPIRQNLDLEAFRAETKLPLRTDVSLQQTARLPRACSATGRPRRWAWRGTTVTHSSGSACRPSSSSSMSGSNSSHPSAAQGAAHAMAASDEPLGLTVHSMPSPNQALDGAEGRRTVVGRWKMLAVMLMCAAPVIASYFTYYVIRPKAEACTAN